MSSKVTAKLPVYVVGLPPRLASASGALLVVAILLLSGAVAKAVEDKTSADMFEFQCGPPRRPGINIAPVDYRERLVSQDVAGGVSQLNYFHTDKALAEMRKSRPYSPNVVSNLDFALRHCPNHHLALATLIDWESRGGAFYDFPFSNCYLQWAHEFAKDDATVLMYGGNYFAKKHEVALAKAWYEKALEIDPSSAEFHYNYGLFLAGIKEYPEALRHAEVAYAAGFPLPGLRRKLEQAGYAVRPATAVKQ